MTTSYSAIEHDVQGNIEADLDVVNILEWDENVTDIGIKPAPLGQREAFLARQPDYENPRDVKQAIIHDWLTSSYDAETAVYWLIAFKLLRSPYRGTPYEVMCRAARAEFGAVALPERVSAPIPSVSRSDPFQPVSQGRGV
jgi:hypothetical protein